MMHFITDLADAAQAQTFDQMFALYERMFPESERHSYETLVTNMRRNGTRGDVQTLWLASTDDAGTVNGGIGAYIAPGGADADKLITLAYMFVDPSARGKGLARKLEQALIDYVAAPRTLIVCDIEDPQKMIDAGITKADYDEAVALYNINPFERLVFWRDRMGYRGTDFPYTLLVGREGAEPTSVLSLHARLIENGRDVAIDKFSSKILREAASFVNCQCPFAHVPASYRNHPALASMWSWADANTHVRVSAGLAAEYDHLKNHWK